MKPLDVFSLMGWIEANKHRLRPPITNETIYKGNDDLSSWSPAAPTPARITITTRLRSCSCSSRAPSRSGLWSMVRIGQSSYARERCSSAHPGSPTSPVRFADTYGLIIEKYREPHQKDAFIYYCESCGHKLYESYFELKDIVKQLPMVQNEFYSSESLRSCDQCSAVMALPPDWEQSVAAMAVDNPFAP